MTSRRHPDIGQTRDHGPGPQANTGYWLRQAALAWQRELGRRLRPLDLTVTQFMILSGAGWLGARNGIPPTQQQVADLAGTDKMMTSKVTATLSAAGLVDRERHGREVRIRQTAAGRDLTERALEQVRAIEGIFFGAESAQLRKQLAEIAHAMARE